MNIDLLPSSTSYTDEDQENLKQLLEAFGSVISLEDMASTYFENGRSLDLTAERLCTMQTSNYESSFPKLTNNENASSSSSGCTSSNILEIDNVNKSKSKKCSASMGTVSSVIGKDYMKPITQSDGPSQKLKPVKVYSDDFPGFGDEQRESESDSTSQSESMCSDIQEFICKMLGVGFQLEKSVIQDVIGQCGYDMPKSVDKLIDLSAAALNESDDVIALASGNAMENNLNLGSASHTTQTPVLSLSARSNGDVNKADKHVLPETEMKTKDIQREILEALFSGRESFEEKKPTGTIKKIHRSPYGQVVCKPPDEQLFEDFTYITRQPVNDRSDEENPSYEDLRNTVAEYWVIMKAFYKDSVDAYTRNEYGLAQNLLEKGNLYNRKAREADELSAKKLTEESDEKEIVTVHMHYFVPKDALQQMKTNLTSFSGLPSIPYLKAVVGTGGGDKKDVRRKLLITKLLEKEGIPWTEEGNGWIISVRADQIDPKSLSYSKK